MPNISGTNGSDTLSGTLGDDVIDALGGSDRINASQGNDTVNGGAGSDRLIITMSDPTLFTPVSGRMKYLITDTLVTNGTGSLHTLINSIEFINLTDTRAEGVDADFSGFGALFPAGQALVVLGAGNDTYIGSSTRDVVYTGLGLDVVDGGSSNPIYPPDFLHAQMASSASSFAIVTRNSAGAITITDGVNRVVARNFENVAIEAIAGQALYADASGFAPLAGVTLFAMDTIYNDIVIGSRGADVFSYILPVGAPGIGGGNDFLTGGGGADRFDYVYALELATGDHIVDFDANDTIDLQFFNLAGDEAIWLGTGAFTGVAGQVRYDRLGGRTYIYSDVDGNGAADGTIVIENGAFQLYDSRPVSSSYPSGRLNQIRILADQVVPGTNAGETLSGTIGGDAIAALAGNDTVNLTRGADQIDGGDGIDTLRGDMADTAQFGTATGAQVYTMLPDRISNGAGTLWTVFANVERISLSTVGAGNFGDTIEASSFTGVLEVQLGDGANTVRSGSGNDLLNGGTGADALNGGAGNDQLAGGGGEDWIQGAEGDDGLAGGEGHDSVWGGDGNDLLDGGVGDDTIWGGAGIDTVSYAAAASGVEIDLSWLEDQQTRGAGVDTLVSIENVIGSAFNDRLTASNQVNVLTGGGGDDRFVFATSEAAAGDRITDFNSGDRIDLSAIDANGAAAGDAAFAFIGAAAFSGQAGQLRVTGSGVNWAVQGDLNGDAIADFVMDVTLLAPGYAFTADSWVL